MEDLRIKLSLDSSQFESGVSKAESKLGSLKGKMSDIGQGLTSVGTTMTGVGAGMVASVAGIVAKGAEWSASVESTQFLYNNLDKTVQDSIATNAQSAKSLGMTEQQYKKNATTIATYYKNMGVAGQESAELSKKTMDLSADLAAVADVPVDEALGDIKSALMGNYEAVDKYGVSLSANSLENSEYVKSLGKSWNQLSENEKMMAAYNEITRQSSSAQGLAKQEADSFGMQMKLLKESIGETVGQLGEALLPVLEPIIEKFQDIAKKVSDWVKENPELARTILAVVGGLGLFLAVVGPLIGAVGMIGLAMGALSAVSFPVVAAVVGITLAIIALVAAGIYLYTHWEEIKAKAMEIWNKIKESVSKAMETAGETLKNIWEGIKSFFSTCWESIKTTAMNIWNGIKDAISLAIETVKNIITNIWNGIKNFITNCINGIKNVISSVFNSIKSTISNILNGAKDIISNVWDKIKSTFTNACNKVKDTVSNVFNGLKNTVKNALDGIYNTAKKIWDNITGIFSKPIKAVVSIFKKDGKSAPSPEQKNLKISRALYSGYSLAKSSFSGSTAAGAMSSYSRANSNNFSNSNSNPISLNANLNSYLQIDGKTIAAVSAPYMSKELDKLNKRKNRLGGVPI